jgi:hypothetical protein
MTKAKTREEFVKAWEYEFDVLAMLSESLPTKDGIALNYLKKLRELRAYIETAARDTYDPKPTTQPTFKVPLCPSCSEPLKRIEINETLTGAFDPKTGKYTEDGELETKCLECEADLYDVFPDGPCNYQAEEEQQPRGEKHD